MNAIVVDMEGRKSLEGLALRIPGWECPVHKDPVFSGMMLDALIDVENS